MVVQELLQVLMELLQVDLVVEEDLLGMFVLVELQLMVVEQV